MRNKKTILILFCILLFLAIKKTTAPKKEVILDQTNRTFVVKGDVKIKKAQEGSAWQGMDTSTTLEKGDIVETAEGSTVNIIIGKENDKAVKIEERSSVRFNGVNPAYLNLEKGKVLVAIKKLEPKSSFVVKTPTAISGARGTSWSAEAGPNKTTICVFENKIFVQELNPNGKPKRKKYIAEESTRTALLKNKPISGAQKIEDGNLLYWKRWHKNIAFLRDGKALINDFDRKENYNNIDGAFGSWNVFYSDLTQHCRDEVTDLEKAGDSGYALKLAYDVDSPYSAYNGFFTKLMDVDLSDYKYVVFFIKGDREAGFTTKLNLELKNARQIGKMTIDGITDEWKKMALPLNKFADISNFKNMKEFVMVFNDIGVTKKEGIIYIDDIYFSRTGE